MIDLLGDGRLAPRGGGDPILELDLTYKVQTEPGGIAQVVGMAEDFAGGAPLVVVLGDNIFEFAQISSVEDWAELPSRARIFVKEVGDPENFGVVVYGEDGEVERHRREGGRRRHALLESRRPRTRSSGFTATRRTCSTSSPR